MDNKYIPLNIIDKLEKNIKNDLLGKPIKILCKNFDTEQQEVKLLNKLNSNKNNFWNDKTTKWAYYINESEILEYSKINDTSEKFYGFSNNYNVFLKLSDEERIKNLNENKSKLKLLELKKDKTYEEVSDALANSTSDTIMLNKVIFDDLMKLSPEHAKIKSKESVDETSEIVKIANNLLSEYSGDFSIFSQMIEKSNGSTIKHMTRTFVMTLSFFQHYNHLINIGYAAKIRVNFTEKYRKYYEKLLPQEKNFHLITLERVFKGGMTSISELETNAIGVGFLLHDIGKQVDLDYFEGSMGYVKERIQAHVSNGFNELLKRTVYPPVVSAVAGFHHEYYNDESGYGPLREFISKKFPNGITSNYCISYSLKDVYNGEALCFFPAKMLELVDVYDALTDPGRKYRDPMKPLEAVNFIEDKFIKEHVKIDPILFDMFKLYLKYSGEL